MKGSCLCGDVKFVITGDIQSFYLCHCIYCKKGSGSAAAANLFVASADIHWLAGESLRVFYQVPNSLHVRCFCSQCGSPVPMVLDESGLVMLPAGCLDDDITKAPDAHIFIKREAQWERQAVHAKCFAGEPDSY
ncbi:GFA family protein [Gilvimarinus sp. SDUM040013]|uniref:GFA family protein n=1 Tax=Gilvimarinus gilvus TaxID=3058038 RepID=A0ABU4RUQ2_9GAMM|nr:GFA family protein [Gilvimarinus sp. SDUM040013]MDO3388518.1 GFA family protein [Gilvimarinus sp. SDUM040013]MDX6848610.1 GFA family protein [Gilvimarinus sp. SDUM040013]